MSLPSSLTPLFSTGSSAAGGYQVERSLRFNSADSAYLSRTPAVAGDRTKWTWAGWVKRSKIGNQRFSLFCAGNSGSDETEFFFQQSTGTDSLVFYYYPGSYAGFCGTLMLFRDTSAWYHIVLALDTTQGTASDRCKIYVNGVQQSTNFTSNFGPSATPHINSTAPHQLGRSPTEAYPYDGYLADVWFLDGLTPSTTVVNGVTQLTQLGEFDATTGVWNPKAWDGAALTGNSFHLDFADNSALTSGSNAGIGKDTSGLGNYWNTSGLSVTAGAGNDSLVDSPTNYGTDTSGVGGEVRGNYATLNPLDYVRNLPVNGNLDLNGDSTSFYTESRSTIWFDVLTTDGFYAEFTSNSQGGNSANTLQVVDATPLNSSDKGSTGGVGIGARGSSGGNTWWGLTGTSSGTDTGISHSNGQILGLAVKNGKIYIAIDGTWVLSGNPTTESNPLYSGLTGLKAILVNTLAGSWSCNFGQRAFAYTAPSGFKALCTQNLPAPVIAKPNQHFDAITYTGNGSTLTIPNANSTPTSIAFDPGFIWFKQRASPKRDHNVYDVIRGTTKLLSTNGTSADASTYDVYPGTGSEQTVSGLTAFNTGSKTVDVGSSNVANGSSSSYVAWAWYAGANSSKTYTVTVSGGIFYIDGKSQPTINLEEGSTYIFDQSAASNSGHPLRFSLTANGPTEYTTGVTTAGTPGNSGAYTQIAVASGAPALYYYCTNHSGMGGAINTNTTAGASNFVGSITSTVRANASAGFSVVTYTGNGVNGATVGHGLGVAPSLIICKVRNTSDNWCVYHASIGASLRLNLNTTAGTTSGTAAWGTAPTSTVFSIGTSGEVNTNANTFVAYCFSSVVGYSSFGSYTGNGSADGPFVYTGMRPKFLLIKRTDTSGYPWVIVDSLRDGYNLTYKWLEPNSSSAEQTAQPVADVDFLSNGFKLKGNGNTTNQSSGTYVFAGFAESPFQYARAR